MGDHQKISGLQSWLANLKKKAGEGNDILFSCCSHVVPKNQAQLERNFTFLTKFVKRLLVIQSLQFHDLRLRSPNSTEHEGHILKCSTWSHWGGVPSVSNDFSLVERCSVITIAIFNNHIFFQCISWNAELELEWTTEEQNQKHRMV